MTKGRRTRWHDDVMFATYRGSCSLGAEISKLVYPVALPSSSHDSTNDFKDCNPDLNFAYFAVCVHVYAYMHTYTYGCNLSLANVGLAQARLNYYSIHV